MGDGRAEGSLAIGDGGQAAISLTPDFDGTNVCIFESLQLEGSYVGDLLYGHFNNINSSNPRAWDIFPFLCIIFKYLHQCFIDFKV